MSNFDDMSDEELLAELDRANASSTAQSDQFEAALIDDLTNNPAFAMAFANLFKTIVADPGALKHMPDELVAIVVNLAESNARRLCEMVRRTINQ